MALAPRTIPAPAGHGPVIRSMRAQRNSISIGGRMPP
jgi:hypothetical protein